MFYLLHNRFFILEDNINMGVIDMDICYKYTIIINFMMSLFANCTINSKIKLYMRLFLIIGFLGLSLKLGFFIYMVFFYKSVFSNQFAKSLNINPGIRYTIRYDLTVEDGGPNQCTEEVYRNLNTLVFNYSIVSIISFILTFIIYVLARVAVMININEPKKEIPKLEVSRKVGFDSASLRKKRFIDSDIHFNTTVINKPGEEINESIHN
ncbi:hypothetical protein EDEG_00940 [Edhazardia aedis USNM 41457]|uniref:Uncharacterized protein n=1 Tax=Edhazardia aedis (strain USNM 41457) TaxID=1003232 RepID=J9DBP2_EDHAE|nr:hypothetical protein EDEG_00940 [Edhazardia aedis USNM 41457]|eukprot:EJW04909.1 hypothetical protein EDEG_00940 [Edhazardia aedis USNM 41457]